MTSTIKVILYHIAAPVEEYLSHWASVEDCCTGVSRSHESCLGSGGLHHLAVNQKIKMTYHYHVSLKNVQLALDPRGCMLHGKLNR